LLLYQIPVDLGLVDKDKYTDESGNILHTIRQKASLFSITDDNRGSKVNLGGVDPQELFLSSHKIDVEEPFSSSSLGRLSCGKIAGIDFDKIVGSPFECFLVNFTGHVIAVRRDSENKDLFWVYDPNSVAMASATIKKLGNPAKVGAKYLEAYLREIAYVYSKEYPTDTAVGFNFTKPEPRALSSTKVKIKKSV